MTLRSKSRKQRTVRWLSTAGWSLVAYVVVSRLACGSVSFDLTDPGYYRLFVPLLAVAAAFAWEMRWDGVDRTEEDRQEAKASGEEAEKAKAQDEGTGQDDGTGQDEGTGEKDPSPVRLLSSPQTPQTSPAPCPVPAPPVAGEEAYRLARSVKHSMIPTYGTDADYLNLLGKSAAEGYAPALAKLGEYAMRRAAWTEAYYWMKQAQRNGMHGLSPTLRMIRTRWAADGFPRQLSNVSEIFTEEAASLGRALLRVDSGHEAAKGKEFLKTNHPEFYFGR